MTLKDHSEMFEYYLKSDWQTDWIKVTKEQFIQVERSLGFKPKISSTHVEYMITLITDETDNLSGCGVSDRIKFFKTLTY